MCQELGVQRRTRTGREDRASARASELEVGDRVLALRVRAPAGASPRIPILATGVVHAVAAQVCRDPGDGALLDGVNLTGRSLRSLPRIGEGPQRSHPEVVTTCPFRVELDPRDTLHGEVARGRAPPDEATDLVRHGAQVHEDGGAVDIALLVCTTVGAVGPRS